MTEENMENNNLYAAMNAAQIWEKICNKELNCKKSILEYIETIRLHKKETLTPEQLADIYQDIYDHIDGLRDSIKPNTMLFLKNNLKTQLGKYVKIKDPKQTDHFIEFLKLAYPDKSRRSDYTWVLMDLKKITEEQIWTTLTYINKEGMSNELRLTPDQKKDIIEVIEMGVRRNNIKFINKIRSLKTLTEVLGITIVSVDDLLTVKRL